MNLLQLHPPAEKTIPFTYPAVAGLVGIAGCYLLTNAGGDILYIGQALSLGTRLRQHLDNGKHRQPTMWGLASLASFSSVEPKHLSRLERGWIGQCELIDGALPPLNRVRGPI